MALKNTNVWYDLDVDLPPWNPEDETKAVFRYVSFDILLQMLNEHSNYLVRTSTWEDVYENFMSKENIKLSGVALDFKGIVNGIYGQCWTRKKSSDAMWRIYSPDRKSVRIKTTLAKLKQIAEENNQRGSFQLGEVHYYRQSAIEDALRSLPEITRTQLEHLLHQSFFVKRNSFSHESEYRLLFVADPKVEDVNTHVKSFKIDPLSFIENIYFDPRAEQSYVDRCTRILVDVFAFSKARIKKSKLYSFAPVDINVVG